MPRHVIHVYELGWGVGDPPFQTLAIAGPFDDVAAAADALVAMGWHCRHPDTEPMSWETPHRGARFAEIVETQGVPVAS